VRVHNDNTFASATLAWGLHVLSSADYSAGFTFLVTDQLFLNAQQNCVNSFTNVRKGRLVNAVTTSFNTIMTGQMAEMSQRREKKPICSVIRQLDDSTGSDSEAGRLPTQLSTQINSEAKSSRIEPREPLKQQP